MSEITEVTVAKTAVAVTITGDTPAVTITTGTPQVTIYDHSSTITTTIEAAPEVTIAADTTVTLSVDQQPTVVVNTGAGNAYDESTLLSMLTDKLTYDQLNATLQDDITHNRDMWNRIGNEIVLLFADGADITTANQTYTDTEISSAVADLHVTITGEVDLKISTVTQTASELQQTVTDLEQDIEGNFTAKQTQITQNADSITSTTTRVEALDGAMGLVTQHTSQIAQNGEAISLEITNRTALGTTVNEHHAEIVLNTTNIGLQVSQISSVEDRMDTAETNISVNSITNSVNSTLLGTHEYSIEAVETLLANRWALNIAEDAGGNKYSTGFQLMLHPIWIMDTVYTTVDTIFYDEKVYECILGHTATLSNNPDGTSGSTYWAELVGGTHSEFVVEAEKFKIAIPTEAAPVDVFTVTSGTVRINGTLITDTLEAIAAYIEMSIQSTNYIEGTSGWRLDKNGDFNIYGGTATFGAGTLPSPTSLDNAAYFPGTMNFNPTGGVLNSSGLPAGWFRTYNTSGSNPLSWDATEEALSIDNDSNVMVVCSAFPVLPNVTYKLKIKFRTLSAHAGGLYVRIQELDTELPSGKYAVGYTTGSHDSEVEPATRTINTWLENEATTTSYVEEEFEYTSTFTAKWVSISIWNWVGIGTDTLYIKYLTVVNKATDNTNWESSSDSTQIDGGQIHADSSVTIGNTVDGNYCTITGGDISFYQYIASDHRMTKTLKRIENGTVINNVTKTLPGYWIGEPSIIISPYHLSVFDESYASQDQELRLSVEDLEETGSGTGIWKFTPKAELVISSNSAGTAVGETGDTTDTSPTYDDMAGYMWSSLSYMTASTTFYNMAESNIKIVTTTIKAKGYGYGAWTCHDGDYDYHYYGTLALAVRLHYFDGSWHTTSWTSNKSSTNTWQTWTVSSPTTTNDITHIYADVRFVAASGITPHGTGCTMGSGGHPEGSGDFLFIEVELDAYSANLSGTTVIATGSLNYIAIGQ